MYNFGVVMTEEEKKLLSTFEARLRHLIYLHDELKRENAELKQLLEDERSELEKVRAEYKALESSYTDLKTATTISLNGSDVKGHLLVRHYDGLLNSGHVRTRSTKVAAY